MSAQPRPLVVLVPDAMAWVLGSWAREIARYNADAFDFAIFPLAEIREAPGDFAAVLAEASLVHCISQFAYAEVAARVKSLGARGVRLISSVHHMVEPEDAEACLLGDRIAVMCESVADQLVGLGVPRERLFLLRKGVDTERLRPRPRAAARKRLGIPADAFAVGVSAKASSDDRGRKGLDVLFAALEELPPNERPLHLVVTGPGWAGPLALHLPEAVQVHRFDYLADDAMPDFYSALDVYLSTSRVEGGPLPPLEAMSCETPVVSTPVGTVRDLVSDGAEGLLVPVGDAKRTAAALARLRDDPDVAAGLGRAGRRRIESSLDVRRVSRSASDLYASLLGPPRTRRLDRETLAADDAARIERDLARWQREIARAEAGTPGAAVAARSLALPGRLRRLLRRLDAGLAPLAEVAHIDLRALGVNLGARVMDLGCGAGQLSLPLSRRAGLALCVDLDMPRLRELRAAGAPLPLPVRAVRADATRLPLADASLDAVVCREMLEHVEDPGAVLDEVRRVLSPRGKLCVTVPSAHTERWFQWVDSRWLHMAGHVNVFERRELCALLAQHGFRVTSVRGRNCFYSFFWFVHTLVRTTHDGTGRIQDHHGLAARLFRLWSRLGEGRLRRCVEALGNLVVPKSYVYYCEPCEPVAGSTRRA